VRVLNRDDATVMRMADPDAQMTTFGTGEPDAPGSFGLVNERGVLWLASPCRRRAGKEAPRPFPEEPKSRPSWSSTA
jgi:hypothetical protein